MTAHGDQSQEPPHGGAERRPPATEQAFSSPYWRAAAPGIYRCANCGRRLFGSAQKFDSGTGWPSFWAPVAPGVVHEEPERTRLLRRTRVACADCQAHLGYLFRDGPNPTGLRYCINGSALSFEPERQPEPAQ
jgi:peptide-methionine (R)-S-oxide reductase